MSCFSLDTACIALFSCLKRESLGSRSSRKQVKKKSPQEGGQKGPFFQFKFIWVACCFYFKVSLENLLKIDPTYNFPFHFATPLICSFKFDVSGLRPRAVVISRM